MPAALGLALTGIKYVGGLGGLVVLGVGAGIVRWSGFEKPWGVFLVLPAPWIAVMVVADAFQGQIHGQAANALFGAGPVLIALATVVVAVLSPGRRIAAFAFGLINGVSSLATGLLAVMVATGSWI